jgi:ATP-dependent DNA ligase
MLLCGHEFAPVLGSFTPADAEHFFLDAHLYQEKIDGKRAACALDSSGHASFMGRSGPELPEFPTTPALPLTVLDGELGRHAFHAFDLLQLHGQDLRAEPLWFRWRVLADLPMPPWIRRVQTVSGEAEGRSLLEHVLAAGGEGVVRKNPRHSYPRSNWVRLKRLLTFDVLLLSVDPAKASAEVGEVIEGKLRSVGKIYGVPAVAAEMIGEMVEVQALEKTPDGLLQHGRFIRFRFDKPFVRPRLGPEAGE